MLSRFHLIPERYGRTDGQTDRQTDRFSISISHVSMLTRDKNSSSYINYSTRELFFVTLSYTRARCNYGHRLKACFRSTIITFCRRCGIRIDIKSQSCYHHHHHHFICSVKCKNTLAKTREY